MVYGSFLCIFSYGMHDFDHMLILKFVLISKCVKKSRFTTLCTVNRSVKLPLFIYEAIKLCDKMSIFQIDWVLECTLEHNLFKNVCNGPAFLWHLEIQTKVKALMIPWKKIENWMIFERAACTWKTRLKKFSPRPRFQFAF